MLADLSDCGKRIVERLVSESFVVRVCPTKRLRCARSELWSLPLIYYLIRVCSVLFCSAPHIHRQLSRYATALACCRET